MESKKTAMIQTGFGQGLLTKPSSGEDLIHHQMGAIFGLKVTATAPSFMCRGAGRGVSTGQFVTAAAVAYPGPRNEFIAQCLVRSATKGPLKHRGFVPHGHELRQGINVKLDHVHGLHKQLGGLSKCMSFARKAEGMFR